MLRRIFAIVVALFAFATSAYAIMTPAFLRKRAQAARIPQGEILEPEKYTMGDSQTAYTEGYYTQTLDHFSYGYGTNANLQWRMRYLFSDQYWGGAESLSPIFVYCGNEGDITGFWNNSGFMVDTLAPQFKAYLLFPEHRYFGESLPFGLDSLSKTNLVYLTPDQAMADYAVFLHYYKTEVLKCTDCPVIAFGGSYGGMLAAWMRMKYPNIVDGSWAASAPVLYFDDVTSEEAFFQVASWDFGNVTSVPLCAQMIKEGYNRLDKYVNLTFGNQFQQINQIFNTCTPLTHNHNLSAVEDWLTNGYTYMAMVDYPYPTSFLTPMPGSPVNFSCQAFIGLDTSVDDQTLFTAIYNAVKVFYNYQNLSQCNEVFDQSSGLGSMNDEAWNVLACTEVVIPQGSNGVDDIFPARPWSYDANSRMCQSTYGVQSRYDWALNEFGGWDANRDFASYSNIFFSNGLLDPWHPGGVLNNISDTVVAYVIPESAHHLDLRSPNPADPESVVVARQIEAGYINTWVTKKQEKVRARENFISI